MLAQRAERVERPQRSIDLRRERVVEDDVGLRRVAIAREEVAVDELPREAVALESPAVREDVRRPMAEVPERPGVREREPQRIEVALEAHELDRRVAGRAVECADQRHRIVRGAKSDVPHDERTGPRERGRDVHRLPHVDVLRLAVGGVDRVHDLA